MEDLASWIRPIVSGLAGFVVVWLMVSMTKEASERKGDLRILTYSKSFKIFSALMIPFAIFVVYGVTRSYKGQEIAAFLVATGFVSAAIFFSYQAFLTKFAYDHEYIYYKSPLAGDKKEPWANLVNIGHSSLLQADFIVVKGIGRIWCSNMLNGYSELGEFIDKKIEELYPEES